jgi:hypothetical protein
MDDFLNFVEYLEYIELEIGNIDDIDNNVPRRYLRNVDDPFELYNENQFFKRYRFPIRVVLETLLELININYTNNRGLPIPIVLQLLTTLRFYATSNFQVGSLF